MRIFNATPCTAPGETSFSELLSYDFTTALNELGHEVEKFTWDFPGTTWGWGFSKWLRKNKVKRNQELIKAVKRAHEHRKIDLYLTLSDERFIFPETICQIKKLGIPTLNFVTNDGVESEFMKMYKDIAPVFDYNWTIHLRALRSYDKIGAKAVYTPLGANPHEYKPYNCKREFDVTFMGVKISYREELLRAIVDAGISLHVWGVGWTGTTDRVRNLFAVWILGDHQKRTSQFFSRLIWYTKHSDQLKTIFNPPLPNDEMIKMYSRSRISLGFAGASGRYMYDFHKAPRTIKGRDIEAPMSGAFYLTEYIDEIARLYKIGKEIETYQSIPELIDKIKYYLENPDEAEAIRKAGRKRALKDYTWAKCFEQFFNKIGIS